MAEEKKSSATSVMTPWFRVSYPHIFKPQENKQDKNKPPEYSMACLFKKGENLDALKAAAKAALVKKFGENEKMWPKKLKSPFRDQAEKAVMKENEKGEVVEVLPDGYEAGAIFMNVRSKQKPGLLDRKKQPITDESQFYAGCWARATVNAYAFDTAGNQGVAFGLGNIQKCDDGEPLGGRTKAEDDFEALDNLDENGNVGDATSLF